MKAQRDNRTRAESVGTFEFPAEGHHGPGNSDCMDVEGAKERSDSKFGYTKVSKSRLYQSMCIYSPRSPQTIHEPLRERGAHLAHGTRPR